MPTIKLKPEIENHANPLFVRDLETDTIHRVIQLDYDKNEVVMYSPKYNFTSNPIEAVQFLTSFEVKEQLSEEEYQALIDLCMKVGFKFWEEHRRRAENVGEFNNAVAYARNTETGQYFMFSRGEYFQQIEQFISNLL